MHWGGVPKHTLIELIYHVAFAGDPWITGNYSFLFASI